MTTKYWLGTADTVQQVSTGEITAYDAATTYTVTVGGVAISQVGTGGTAAATAAALVALLNASTHPYFAAVTWSVPSGAQIRGTADIAGVPFVAALSVSSGTGTRTDFSTGTSNAGPNDWSTATNWSDGAIPANGDTVIFRDSAIPVCWGLAQSGVTATAIIVEQSYTGKIGLDRKAFATSANGATVDTSKAEYRDTYCYIGWDTLDLGQNPGPGNPAGSQRLKFRNAKAGASTTTIHNTASQASETGLPAVRLLAAHASADVYVRSAPGGVGIAVDVPGETATVGAVRVSDPSTGSRVFVGAGTTITTFEQLGGNNLLQAAATVTTVNCDGGILTVEGDYTITAETVTAGTVYENHVKSAGNAITTLTVTGGTVDATRSAQARTWATVNHDGGTIKADDAVVTMTTLDQPDGLKSVTVSAV